MPLDAAFDDEAARTVRKHPSVGDAIVTFKLNAPVFVNFGFMAIVRGTVGEGVGFSPPSLPPPPVADFVGVADGVEVLGVVIGVGVYVGTPGAVVGTGVDVADGTGVAVLVGVGVGKATPPMHPDS